MPTLKNPPYILRLSENTKKQNKVSKSKKKILTGYGKVAKVFFIPKKNQGKRNGQFEFWRKNSKPSK